MRNTLVKTLGRGHYNDYKDYNVNDYNNYNDYRDNDFDLIEIKGDLVN